MAPGRSVSAGTFLQEKGTVTKKEIVKQIADEIEENAAERRRRSSS